MRQSGSHTHIEVASGARVAAQSCGDPDGPAVVLAHGGGQTRHAWNRTAERLAESGYRCISIDLPGHGDSDWYPDGRYHNTRMAADMYSVCREFGSPLAWVGASLGGLLSLSMQYRFRPLSALVLVDIAPRMETVGVDRVLAFMRGRPDGFASVEEAAEYVAGYLPHRRRPRSTEGLRKNLRQREDGRYVWHWDPKIMAPEAHGERMHENDFEAAAASLDIPSLLVRGQWSDVLSEDGAREFQELVPGSEYVDLKGAAHMVAGDVNDVFTDTVVDFLDRKYHPLAAAGLQRA